MKMSYKIIMGLLLTGALITGVVLNPYAREERQSNEPVYTAMLEKTFNQSFLSYRYEVKVYDDEVPVDTSYGMICKSGHNFIDSNNMYYKMLSDELYVNFDKNTAVAYYMLIKDVEQKMGFRREDLNAEIFSMPDSSIARIGQWKPVVTINDSLSAIEFEVTDSVQQIRKMRFVIRKKEQQIKEAELSVRVGADILGSASRSAIIKMYNIVSDSVDLQQKAQQFFSVQDGKIQPAGNYRQYTVKKIF